MRTLESYKFFKLDKIFILEECEANQKFTFFLYVACDLQLKKDEDKLRLEEEVCYY